MQTSKLQKVYPHLIAICIFLILSVVYFSPVVFQAKDLPQGDVTSVQGWQKELIDYNKTTGEYAFWTNAMFGGMPANSIYIPPTVNSFSCFGKIISLNLSYSHIGIVFLYLFGFYIFLISIGCKPWLSIIGAIAYAFASYNFIIIEAGHINKGLAMATMAPILGGVILCYRQKYLWGSLITLLFTGLNVAYIHQQISYYLLLILLVLAIVYFIFAIRERKIKEFFISSALLVVLAGIALLPNMGNFLPTYDYAKDTMRGGAVLKNTPDGQKEGTGLDIDYAYAWSYGKMESFTLLIPNFNGASSHYNVGNKSETYDALRSSGQADSFTKNAPMYWGDQPFTSGPVYAGAIICFLFVLGLFVVKGPEKWWILFATLLSLLLAWGRHFPAFNTWFFEIAPFYNKFRTPSMALTMAGVTMPLMAILAIKELISNEAARKKIYSDAKYALTITGGSCLFFALFAGAAFDFSSASDMQNGLPDWLLEAIRSDRKSMLTTDAIRSLAFILAAFGLIWAYVKNKIKVNTLIIVLGVLILFDLWSVDKRFVNDSKFVSAKRVKEILPTDADLLILQDKDPNYRVLNMSVSTFNDATTSYFHKSVGGYSPAKLRRYQDIIDYHFSKGVNVKVLNMLNTRYFIIPSQEGGPQVQKNVAALGNAWFVDQVKWVNSPDEEIVSLNGFEPADTAIVDVIWKDKITNFKNGDRDSSASIVMDVYQPGYLKYTSKTKNLQLAVFSEIFYDKTWTAYIDGKEVPHFRVNYILRAMEVPKGKHTIEFKCDDKLFHKAASISLYGSIFVGLIVLGLLFFIFKPYILKSKKQSIEK